MVYFYIEYNNVILQYLKDRSEVERHDRRDPLHLDQKKGRVASTESQQPLADVQKHGKCTPIEEVRLQGLMQLTEVFTYKYKHVCKIICSSDMNTINLEIFCIIRKLLYSAL